MNKLELAEALIVAADTGSISQAAAKLNQTSAAISKKLSKLESHLDAQLLVRHKKGITLTYAGQRYYHEAKKAISQLNLAELAVTEEQGEPKGELRVTANQFYSETMILPKLPDFLKKYPHIIFNLDVSEILPDFNAKKMDVFFGTGLPAADNVVRKRLFYTHYVLCASPNYLKEHPAPQSSEELFKHRYITHSARKQANLIPLHEHEPIFMEPILFVNNMGLMIKAALLGLGIIWTYENMVSELLKEKKLIRILEDYTQQRIPVYAYYVYQKYQDSRIKAFIDFFTPKNISP